MLSFLTLSPEPQAPRRLSQGDNGVGGWLRRRQVANPPALHGRRGAQLCSRARAEGPSGMAKDSQMLHQSCISPRSCSSDAALCGNLASVRKSNQVATEGQCKDCVLVEILIFYVGFTPINLFGKVKENGHIYQVLLNPAHCQLLTVASRPPPQPLPTSPCASHPLHLHSALHQTHRWPCSS